MQELARLTRILRADPSSAVAAAVEGWEHPVSREAAVLMDLFDLEAAKSGVKKPPRYTRPWKTGDTKRHGNTAGRTREEVVDILARARRGELNPV